MYNSVKISCNPFRGLTLKTFAALLLPLLIVQESPAQVLDDFSDGDFRSDPAWNGSTDDFIVDSNSQLRLGASAAGTSYLYLDFPMDDIGDFEWQVYVKQSFPPSGGNFGRVYLMSDESDLRGSLNGYYLQFGEAGSADAIELFRQSGSSFVSVCRASDGKISASFALRVKVTRNKDGLWKLYVDYAGGTEFILEASGMDATYFASRYTGIMCTYTITNASRFYYDDVEMKGLVLPDTTPPMLVSAGAASAQSVDLVFSEPLDKTTAEGQANYYCPAIRENPLTAILQEDGKSVRLLFSGTFTNGEETALTVRNIRDPSGNVIAPVETEFLYFEPSPVLYRDVVITELLADPAPQVRLPSFEFAEVFNRSPNPIQVAGWSLTDGSSTGKFPSFILLPGKYLILCASSAIDEFSKIAAAVALSNFPTLNNGTDRLRLIDANGLLIDSVNYASSWYADDDKAEGGWSLELIDPQNTCAEKTNWAASVNVSGGTPGEQNSVYANKPDNTGPALVSAYPSDSITVEVGFSERLENVIPAVDNFHIDPLIPISRVRFKDAALTSLTLSLASTIESSTEYILTVNDIFDCPGNKIQDAFSHVRFVLPESAVEGDIVINEILPDPRPTGVDFVEVLNRSDKTINLQKWSIRNSTTSASASVISDDALLIGAGEYRAFTADANVLKGEYVAGHMENFAELVLPPFNDDAGSVAIVDQYGNVIDSMHYTVDMHSPFLRDPEGVSLERISADIESDASNWRSAASDAGFATPGYINSNVRTTGISGEPVTVEPELLQSGSSHTDFARIKYHFNQGGFIANVKIFDQQGRTVREVARNELLGAEGFFRWDGDADDGSRAREGYYMVWFQIFNATGTMQTFRKRIAIF